MNALFLLLALQPQGGPVHADLHPPESDLYIEVGDLPALWKAYDQAPVVRLLHDEKVKALLGGLGVQFDPSPRNLLKHSLASLLPNAQVDAWLDGARALSASLVAAGSTEGGSTPYGFTAIADFAEPAQAEAAKQALLMIAKEHGPLSAPLPGVERLKLEEGEPELWCTALGARLVVGGGAAKVEDYAARTERRQPGLGSSESLRRGAASFEKTAGANVFWYAQRRSALDVLASLEPGAEGEEAREFLAQIPDGLNPLSGERIARMQLVGDRFVTEMFAPGAERGAHALGEKPIESAWLVAVPAGAMLFYSSSLNGDALGKALRGLLAGDEARTAALAALEEKLGFGPERVFARLGPALTLYLYPLTVIGLPETRLWVDCADPQAFQADLEALATALGETFPGLAVRTRPYKVKNDATGEKTEVPYTTITLPSGVMELGPLKPSPAFAPVGSRLVFALNSMDLKSELKRIYGGEGEPIASGANPLSARGFELPDEPRSVVVMDWAKLLAGALGQLKAVGSTGMLDLPFDVTKLPPPELFTTYIRPTFHYSRRTSDGLYRRNEASFGPETWLGLAGLWLMQAGHGAATLELEPLEPGDAASPPSGGGDGD